MNERLIFRKATVIFCKQLPKFYIPAGGMYIPRAGIYVPRRGMYVPAREI